MTDSTRATAAFVDVLDDPTYWQTERPTVKDVIVPIASAIITVALAVTVIAIVVIVYRTTVDNNHRQVQQETTCLKAGGQWIKGDCINNLIHLNG